MRQLFSFPDPVNETSARVVAAGVVLQAVAFLITGQGWLLVPLVYGFVARVATGPTLSPLGQFATRIVTPRLTSVEHRFVPGPPKRFAQAIGVTFTSVAAVAWLADAPTVSVVVIGLLAIAATLESAFAVCLGCIAYRFFWECDDCNDISERLRVAMSDGVPATN
ncbi:MAG: DUF4395 domain-containing protein [Ilumatobacteraceae bacterium]|nr:DUF4395 domain-containing protein [Ilumatobacteraceae bacterium]